MIKLKKKIDTGFLDKNLNKIYVGSKLISDYGKRYLVCQQDNAFYIKDFCDVNNEQFINGNNDNILDDCTIDIS